MQENKMIGFEIRALNNLIKRDMERTRPPEIDCSSGVHGWAIRYFYEHREVDVFQRDFEAFFSIRRSTATRILQLMEKKELIRRESVDYDARLKRIVLTEKAVRIHMMIAQDIKLREERLSKGIAPEELNAFFKVTDKIRANLEVD